MESGSRPDLPETGGGLPPAESAARRHLRGSSLLLFGRLLALATNFLAQVLTVRYLAKSDYGAFAYALSIVSMGACVNLLGLQRAVSRFLPIFHERRDYGSMAGTLLVALGAICGLGLAIVLLAVGLQGFLSASVVTDPLSVGLLMILIALCPLEALDSLFEGVAAVLASPRSIFFRRHVLGPALKLAAVLLVIAVEGSVFLLAICYLAAALIGVLVYVLLLHRVFRDLGLLRGFDRRVLRFPAREILGFSLPLLTADAILILKTTIAVVILESFWGSVEVAEFRAVLPVAGLSLVVLQSFKFLFTPAASRLFARNDAAGLTDLYWQTAFWITIATFPVFAVCFFLADPVTVFLFGDRYADAGIILAVLVIGNYFNASMGLNAYTLQVYARVGTIALANIASTLLAIILNLLLIRAHGALGAAVATASAMVVQNALLHLGLWRHTDIALLEGRRWMVYASVLAVIAALLGVKTLLHPPVPVMVILVAVASLALVRIHRRALRIAATFPELRRVPLMRNLLAPEDRR